MSKTNHFFIAYAGNKRNEFHNLDDIIDYKNKKYIIEPFCGSSAISFNIWKNKKNEFTYILNDHNKELIDFYELFKTVDVKVIEEELTKLYLIYFDDKEKYNELKHKKDKSIYEKLFGYKVYYLRPWMFPTTRPKKKKEIIFSKIQKEFIDFIKQDYVKIMNKDWFEIYNEYKDNSKSILIFDPPYINSDNSFYKIDGIVNVYEYIHKNNMHKNKSYIYFMLESSWIVDLIFSKFKTLKTYDKTYEITRRKTIHKIFCNK